MTPQDKQRLKILVVLLAVFGLTIVFGYQMNRPQTAAAIEPPQVKISEQATAPSDAHIRIDLVEKGTSGEQAGGRNLFQYGQPRPQPQPPVTQAPPTAATITPQPSTPAPPPPPPPPPPIPLRYQGYAHGANGLTAFLGDDQRHFNATVGEVLMGRYRIERISETAVEVEDLEYNRRQTLPLLK